MNMSYELGLICFYHSGPFHINTVWFGLKPKGWREIKLETSVHEIGVG